MRNHGLTTPPSAGTLRITSRRKVPLVPVTANWKQLGEQLVRRRIELDPRYANRRLFADERGVNYRTVSDVERGRRDNYEDATITALEVAYAVKPGSVSHALAGGELEPLPGARPSLAPVPPLVTEGSAAAEVLAPLLSRYAGDDVIRAIGAQRGKPPWMITQEILRWLERQGDEAPAREVLTGLLSGHPEDEVIQVIGRQRGKKASMVTAEILEWLDWRPPEAEAGNGTAG